MSDFSSQLPIPVNSPTKPALLGEFDERDGWRAELRISEVAPAFLEWARFEMRRAPTTIESYRDALHWVVRDIGDLAIAKLHRGHLLALRRSMQERGCGEARMAGILNPLRSLLKFAQQIAHLPVLDYRDVRVPRVPRRDVVYLDPAEVRRFREAIMGPTEDWRDVPIARLRLRAITEVLLGTGARISEVISLDRRSLIVDRREAKIIGKGNKQRTIFFTEESMEWVQRYLSRREDTEDPLFVSHGQPRRLAIDCLKNIWSRIAKKAGITKKVTAHILRHTMATTLLFNGCPIGHIKELLGHDRLDTTCRYYLGLDIRAAKAAHEKFLTYDE
jgi:site-specific recombinase XerD